jgi:hypothetical protein
VALEDQIVALDKVPCCAKDQIVALDIVPCCAKDQAVALGIVPCGAGRSECDIFQIYYRSYHLTKYMKHYTDT